MPDTFGIVRWDGANWSALGSGMQNSVLALTTFNGELIAGGEFTKVGNANGFNRIAKWNGAAWSPLGAGMNGHVRALTTFDGALYAGGEFTKVGNANGFNRIAKWNGSAWSKLGSGVNGNSIVFALTSFGTDLIVGGQFAMAGGVAGTPGIARWNGSTWSSLVSGLNNTVMSLSTFDDGRGPALYVGGYFTAPVGGAANSTVQIARWNGAWSAVGSGMVVTQPGDSMPRAVFALSPSPSGDLLCAGGFARCLRTPSTSLATSWDITSFHKFSRATRLIQTPSPGTIMSITSSLRNERTSLACTFAGRSGRPAPEQPAPDDGPRSQRHRLRIRSRQNVSSEPRTRPGQGPRKSAVDAK